MCQSLNVSIVQSLSEEQIVVWIERNIHLFASSWILNKVARFWVLLLTICVHLLRYSAVSIDEVRITITTRDVGGICDSRLSSPIQVEALLQIEAVEVVSHLTIVEGSLRSCLCSTSGEGFVTWVVAVLHLSIAAIAAYYSLGIGSWCATGLYPTVLCRTTIISNVSYTTTSEGAHHAEVIHFTTELTKE